MLTNSQKYLFTFNSAGNIQSLIERFENTIPLKSISKVIKNKKTIEDIINKEDFKPSEIEMYSYGNIDELKYPNEYNSDSTIIILDDLNGNEMKDPRVEAIFKRGRHSNISAFIISQDYYELPKQTIRTNCNIFHLFKPHNLGDVQNLYQNKASMDMTIKEFKFLCSLCWQDK